MFILAFPLPLSRPITPCLARRSGISPHDPPVNVISSYKAKSPGALLRRTPLRLSTFMVPPSVRLSEAQESTWCPPNTNPTSRRALSDAQVCRGTPLGARHESPAPRARGASQRSHGLERSAPVTTTLHAHGRKAEEKTSYQISEDIRVIGRRHSQFGCL